jgi:predicted permease
MRYRHFDRDLARELEVHRAMKEEELQSAGRTPDSVRRDVARVLGNVTLSREQARGVWVSHWLEDLRRDLRYGLHAFRRDPGFSAAVVVTLALAIGANAAIFGVADEALFRPLPLPNAEELTAIYSFDRRTSKFDSGGTSYPNFQEYRRRAGSFQDLAAYLRYPLDVMAAGVTARLPVEAVSTNYFQTLALAPMLGATFSAPDAMEALISEPLWRRRFQADPNVLGRTIAIAGNPYAVVGIVPARYRGLNLNWYEPPEVWIPLETLDRPVPRFGEIGFLTRRLGFGFAMFGRRAPGVTVAQSQTELQAIAANLAQIAPAGERDTTLMAFDASRSKFWPAYRGQVVLSLTVFAVASAVVLLLACANVFNLLLQRAIARRSETAIRLAIGASRARLLRQMLVESLLLVLPSVPIALLVAYGLGRLVSRFPGALGVSLALERTVDGRVLLFGLSLSLLITCSFGVISAHHASRAGAQPLLKASSYAVASAGAPRLRRILLVVQLSLAMILLVGCGLFGRSLLAGYARIGFSDQHIGAWFNVPDAGLPPQFLERLVGDSAGLPGVASSSVAAALPLSYSSDRAPISAQSGTTVDTAANVVSADYFRTMGIRLLAGRSFTIHDTMSVPGLAVVSRELATLLWGTGDALGQRVIFKTRWAAPQTLEVIGIVENTPTSSIWESATPLLYRAASQSAAGVHSWYWIVRTEGDPAALLPTIRPFWERVAPNVPLLGAQTAAEAVDEALAPQRLASHLFLAFGALALVIVGVYNLTAFSVASRTREIGIRMAMGANPALVVRQIMARTLVIGAVGLVLGSIGAVGLGRLAASLIREVSPYDIATFSGVAGLLAVVAVLAAWLPARRAANVDPVIALRAE